MIKKAKYSPEDMRVKWILHLLSLAHFRNMGKPLFPRKEAKIADSRIRERMTYPQIAKKYKVSISKARRTHLKIRQYFFDLYKRDKKIIEKVLGYPIREEF